MDNLIRLGGRFRHATATGTLLGVLRDGRDPSVVGFQTYVEVPEGEKAALLVAAALALGRPLGESAARVAGQVLGWAWQGIAWSPGPAREFLAAAADMAALDPGVLGAVAVAIRDARRAAAPGGDAEASRAAARLLDLAPPGEHGALDRFTRFHRLALARLASPSRDDAAVASERSGLAQQAVALLEMDGVAALPADLRFDLAEVDLYSASSHPRQLARRSATERLGRDDEYGAAAEAVARAAVERLEAIHAGAVPYQPDRAFTEREVEAVVRAHAVGAAVDAPWLTEVVAPTLARLAVAPTAAKTVPSQSLIIRLAHEVADRPLPESVAALAAAAHEVRHAGVKKKLDHDLRAARKALASAPRTTMRGAASRTARASRAEVTALRARIEASFDADAQPIRPWLEGLLADPALAAVVGAVIWQVDGGPAALWRDGAATDVDGEVLALPAGAAVRPWHPVAATPASREAWRDAILRSEVRQPFRQAFREWYRPADGELTSARTDLFRGLVVSVRPFLGIAHREGWSARSSDGPLRRESRDGLAVEIEADGPLYPGAAGWATLGSVRFQRYERRWADVELGDLNPTTLSEALRGVDLLASVAAYAVADDDGLARDAALSRLEQVPLTAQARVRTAVIARVLRDWPGSDRVTYEDRFARIATDRGDVRVHYSTGLTVEVDGQVLPRDAVAPGTLPLPWLPYDEGLLEATVRSIVRVLSAEAGGRA